MIWFWIWIWSRWNTCSHALSFIQIMIMFFIFSYQSIYNRRIKKLNIYIIFNYYIYFYVFKDSLCSCSMSIYFSMYSVQFSFFLVFVYTTYNYIYMLMLNILNHACCCSLTLSLLHAITQKNTKLVYLVLNFSCRLDCTTQWVFIINLLNGNHPYSHI